MKTQDNIRKLIDYLWEAEKSHYEEYYTDDEYKEGDELHYAAIADSHIFVTLVNLKKELRQV